MVLMPAQLGDAWVLGSVSFKGGTDNQGNSYLLDKLMTTKYPLGVVLMEVACQLGLRNATLRANGLPRLQNEEVDALTNSDFRHFSVARRIPVKLEELQFVVLNEFPQTGDAYITELEALKAQPKRAWETSAPARRRTLGSTRGMSVFLSCLPTQLGGLPRPSRRVRPPLLL